MHNYSLLVVDFTLLRRVSGEHSDMCVFIYIYIWFAASRRSISFNYCVFG